MRPIRRPRSTSKSTVLRKTTIHTVCNTSHTTSAWTGSPNCREQLQTSGYPAAEKGLEIFPKTPIYQRHVARVQSPQRRPYTTPSHLKKTLGTTEGSCSCGVINRCGGKNPSCTPILQLSSCFHYTPSISRVKDYFFQTYWKTRLLTKSSLDTFHSRLSSENCRKSFFKDTTMIAASMHWKEISKSISLPQNEKCCVEIKNAYFIKFRQIWLYRNCVIQGETYKYYQVIF